VIVAAMKANAVATVLNDRAVIVASQNAGTVAFVLNAKAGSVASLNAGAVTSAAPIALLYLRLRIIVLPKVFNIFS
jgi:hypothetical protein